MSKYVSAAPMTVAYCACTGMRKLKPNIPPVLANNGSACGMAERLPVRITSLKMCIRDSSFTAYKTFIL